MNSIPAITTHHLSRRFGDALAVDDLTLEIYSGEVFGLLGPNGAGKTTTVRMLTCLIAPSGGEFTINGILANSEEQKMAIRRSVGILTESPGLYENLSAEHNLNIFATLYEVRNPAEQIEKYLRMLGLWGRRSEATGTFSKGMKQKLAIARALLHEPRVIFLDEPTAGLDPEASHLVREFIESLSQEGRTIILCTHNLDEADRLCDRIGVFKTHMLVVDTPAHLRSNLFGHKVVFHMAQINPNFSRVINTLPGIKTTEILDNKLVVTLDNPETRNPEIIRALVNEGADIQFVGELRRSLEDVYLELVSS